MLNEHIEATDNTAEPTPIAPEPTSAAGLQLVRLMHLSSVSLPVGGFAFSHGLEYAIETGWIRKAAQVAEWTREQLHLGLCSTDVPVLKRVMEACELVNKGQQEARLRELNNLILACRETKELRLTDTAMGEALVRLMNSLELEQPFESSEDVSFVVLFGVAASRWGIDYPSAANGFLWSWLENQIAAATKLVPLGQTQAQQLLVELQPELSTAIAEAALVEEDDIGAGLPGLAIASSKHEHMYTRLFRS